DSVLRDDDAIDGRVEGKKSDDVHAGKEIARSGHIIEKAHALDGGIRFRCWRNEMDLLALAALEQNGGGLWWVANHHAVGERHLDQVILALDQPSKDLILLAKLSTKHRAPTLYRRLLDRSQLCLRRCERSLVGMEGRFGDL